MPLKIPPLTPVPIQPTAAEPYSTFVKNTPPARLPLSGAELMALVQNGGSVHSTVGVVVPPVRTILTANTNYYVAVVGSDSNSGLSPATAFATVQHAMHIIATTLDVAGFNIIVNIGTGTFNSWFQESTVGGGIILFDGNGSGNTHITDNVLANGACYTQNLATDTSYSLDAMSLAGLNDFALIAMNGPGALSLGNIFTATIDLIFNLDVATNNFAIGLSAFAFVIVNSGNGGTVVVNFSVSSALTPGFWDIEDGSIVIDGGTEHWTINNTPIWSVNFGYSKLSNGGRHHIGGGVVFAGTATGPAITALNGSDFSYDTGNLPPGDGTVFVDNSSTANTYHGTAVPSGFTIEKSLWGVVKDGTQSTGKGVAVYYNDGGTSIQLTGIVTTFAGLPASPLVGFTAAITDGKAANCADGSCTTWGTNVTGGGGALNLLLWYNGTHWTLTGK